MRILVFSDIHGDLRALERVLATPADLYISAGDLSTFGRALERCGEALKPLGEKLWVLPGNHETAEENRAFCARFGFVDFHRQARSLAGKDGPTHWAGLGYSNPTPFNTPGEYTEEEIAAALGEIETGLPQDAGGRKPRLPVGGQAPFHLVVHFPPHGTKLDQTGPGRHVGSKVLRAWVERVQPVELYCGHIHECAGEQDHVGATPCFNVGKLGRLVEL